MNLNSRKKPFMVRFVTFLQRHDKALYLLLGWFFLLDGIDKIRSMMESADSRVIVASWLPLVGSLSFLVGWALVGAVENIQTKELRERIGIVFIIIIIVLFVFTSFIVEDGVSRDSLLMVLNLFMGGIGFRSTTIPAKT